MSRHPSKLSKLKQTLSKLSLDKTSKLPNPPLRGFGLLDVTPEGATSTPSKPDQALTVKGTFGELA